MIYQVLVLNFSQEPYIMKLSEDQMAQLLSSFWIQANLPDNLPSKFEAIAHSFTLTLTVLHTMVEFSMHPCAFCILVCPSSLLLCFWIG